jgi:hypothetical protein
MERLDYNGYFSARGHGGAAAAAERGADGGL